MIAHFIISTVEGTMITLCEEYIAPRNTKGARVGKAFADPCPKCKERVDNAWVSFQ